VWGVLSMKRCLKCGLEKPFNCFSWKTKQKKSLRSQCKKCRIEYSATWGKNNPEKKRQGCLNWYKKNSDKAKHDSCTWRKENPEKVQENNKRWNIENKDKRKKLRKNYYENNKHKELERNKIWRLSNKDIIKRLRRDWTIKHPEETKAIIHRRRALINNALGNHNAEDLKKLKFILGIRCLKCGSFEKIQWDHVIPLSAPFNGSNGPTNLQPLCKSCNSSKCARSASDYRTPAQIKKILAVFQLQLFT
jgi:hypothetical protein